MEVGTYEGKNGYLNMLVYGASGAGKTVFAATAPEPLFLDMEGGLLSVAGSRVDRIEIKSLADLKEAYRHLKGGEHKYATVDLPMNVVMTALEAEIKDEVSGAVARRPAMPGRLGFELAGYFDLVLYLYLEHDRERDAFVRRLRSVGDERLVAKDRFGKLPPVIEPSFPLLYHAIFNQRKVRRLRKAK
jgi:hypothetical protein